MNIFATITHDEHKDVWFLGHMVFFSDVFGFKKNIAYKDLI